MSDRTHVSYEECQGELKCANCHGGHPASSRDCPMYQLEKKIVEKKIKNQLTYPAARSQIFGLYPELVSRVPTLRSKIKKTDSFSYAAAAQSVAEREKQNVSQQQLHIIQQQQQAIKQM